MKLMYLTIISLISMVANLLAAPVEEIVKIERESGTLEGTLLVPATKKKCPVALIIAGSGPTDRDGNTPLAGINNSLKMLANGLVENGIASLRYDKRGIGKSKSAGIKERDMRFDHFIKDAEEWTKLLKKDERFSKVIVIGHSQGSLVGMIATERQKADKFVSVAGAGRSVDKTLREQFKSNPFVLELSKPILDSLSKGKTVDNVLPVLNSIFRPSIQPFLISWLKYDPSKEIAKLKQPVLIVQGTTDLQVNVKDAELLAEGNKKAVKKIITGMNHVLKESVVDKVENIKTYNQPKLPLKPELVKEIVTFIKEK